MTNTCTLHVQCTCYVQVLNSVRVNYPMYTFSKNVQRSAADLDLASLGSQACEERERERERERGGGVKRLGPLCLANSSIVLK